MDGRTTNFEVDPNISIEDFKTEVELKMNVPKNWQRLIYKTKLLKAEEKLSTYITKDDETIHLMAITEEQARTRNETQRSSQPANNVRSSQNSNANSQRNASNQQPQNPLGGVMGLLGNLMQDFNNPGTTSHFSTATLDLSSLFGGIPPPPVPRPAGNSATNTTIHSHQLPHGHIHIETTTVPPIRERSGSRAQNQARTEESKSSESSNQDSNRNQNLIVLPHNHLYNANVISNQLMGNDSVFPGPPLPPSGNPRTAVTLLGSYLSNLQFWMSRLQPFMYRAGELLQRERNLSNPVDRAETQHLVNQVGREMEELARALLLSSHYFRDLTIGESPGEFRIRNNPHADFRDLNNSFIESQAANREDGGVRERSTGAQSRSNAFGGSSGSSSVQTPGNSSSMPYSSNPPPLPQPQNIFGTMLQGLLTPQNLNNVMGFVGNISEGAQNRRPQNTSPQQPPVRPNSSQPQPDVNMTPSEEIKSNNRTSASQSNPEERKERAESRQESLNNSFVNNLNLLANSENNPMSNLMQTFLPMFNSVAGNIPGGNPMAQPFRTLFPAEAEGETSFFRNVMLDWSTQDFIALFSGNYDVLTNLHPRTRTILLNDYMNGVDSKENRSRAADRIADEINSSIFLPDELKPNVSRDSNPVGIASKINRKHIEKVINTVLDIDCNAEDNSIFIKRIKRIVRWWLGNIVDSLKPLFTNSLQDVLKMFRANIQRNIESSVEDNTGIISAMFTDTIMQSITSSYNEYVVEKKREDEIEENDRITSQDNKRRHKEEIESKMEVDEEPKIEEEPVNTASSHQAHTHQNQPKPPVSKRPDLAKTDNKKEEQKVEEEKDSEIKKLLEQMDEDESMLVVDPPNKNPRSRAYKALDSYYQNNIESGNSITEMDRQKLTAKQSLTNMLKNSLRESGFSPENIEKMMKDKDLSEEFVNHYKEVLKDEIRERKKDPDYEEGRFPELDRI